MARSVVLASHNAHKIAEFEAILAGVAGGLTVEAYTGPEPVEDGASFDENALLKARAAAAFSGRVSLADDSGITVAVMGGAPGIFSARWSGAHGDDVANRRLLLAQLQDIPQPLRAATFHCTIAVVVPGDAGAPARELVVTGEWPGTIATAESGANGFGYDPVFIPEGSDVTAAELTPAEKNLQSHRSRAFSALVPRLSEIFDSAH